MITIEKAKALRKKIESMSAELTDADALDVPELFPKWSIKEYAVGEECGMKIFCTSACKHTHRSLIGHRMLLSACG